ncbi:MAG: NAD(P)(+) transhydrogenase (Re/Si-specific) subunit beta [Planctomycetota bacterium]
MSSAATSSPTACSGRSRRGASSVDYLYLLATLLFVFGIKRLTSIKTCQQGNRLSELGMLVAIIATLAICVGVNWYVVVAGMLVGGGAGALIAKRTATTQMPEMVAALNGFGGLSSALVAMAYLIIDPHLKDASRSLADTGVLNAVSTPATIIIGMVTLTGSFVAYFKLSGKKLSHPLKGMQRHYLHIAMGLVVIGCSTWQVLTPSHTWMTVTTILLAIVASVLGAFLVMPIGGADMPVVVSLLNSYSGVAGAAAGFVIGNPLLIVVGALVGTSGLILTQIMCKAMNRSLGNVLLGGMGEESVAKDAKDYKSIKSAGPEEVAMLLDGATSVIFVPGYGLAVAQAQHVIKDLGELLMKRGANVRYAIHPVAGRMPGHMNVLLAESDVPYEQLWEMDRINGDFKNTDVVIVVGANDVVNPAAREPTGPIAGMPILDVDQARTVVVIKRSLSPGYAGIKNPLFELDNCLMVFLDAKEALEGIVKEVKDLR